MAHKATTTPSHDAGQTQIVAYDENLLECARTQWQFGDWESLAQLERETLQHHPDRAKLALLAAAGHAQLGDTEKARQFTRLARDWGCGKKLISQVLIAGVHNTLGKASAIAGQEQRAMAHFEDSVRTANSGEDVRLLTQARVNYQIKMLDVKATGQIPAELSVPFHKATYSDISANKVFLTNSHAPCDVYETLAFLHKTLNPSLYLEIGVHEGKSLALAKCEAIGVDPVPQISMALPETTKMFQGSSDDFFFGTAEEFLKRSPDFVFMDGMPLLDYVLRDFINIEQRANTTTLVAVANIYPKYPGQATQRRNGLDWIGDVWKLPQVLAEYRPDLKTLGLDLPDYGLLLVTGLDPKNQILKKKMPDILKTLEDIAEPPAFVMEKHGAVTWENPCVAAFFSTLKQFHL